MHHGTISAQPADFPDQGGGFVHAQQETPLMSSYGDHHCHSRKRQRCDATSDGVTRNVNDEMARQAKPRSTVTTSSARSSSNSPRKQLHNLRPGEDSLKTRNWISSHGRAYYPQNLSYWCISYLLPWNNSEDFCLIPYYNRQRVSLRAQLKRMIGIMVWFTIRGVIWLGLRTH